MSLFLIDSPDSMNTLVFSFQFQFSVFSFQFSVSSLCTDVPPPSPSGKILREWGRLYTGYQCHAIQNTEKRVVLVPKQAKLWLRDYRCQEIEKDHNYLIS